MTSTMIAPAVLSLFALRRASNPNHLDLQTNEHTNTYSMASDRIDHVPDPPVAEDRPRLDRDAVAVHTEDSIDKTNGMRELCTEQARGLRRSCAGDVDRQTGSLSEDSHKSRASSQPDAASDPEPLVLPMIPNFSRLRLSSNLSIRSDSSVNEYGESVRSLDSEIASESELLSEGQTISPYSSTTISYPSRIESPFEPVDIESSTTQNRPAPLTLDLSSLSTSPNRQLHPSPSAPNLRNASTASLHPSQGWAAPPPVFHYPPGRAKRNAKGLSVSIGLNMSLAGSSNSNGLPPATPIMASTGSSLPKRTRPALLTSIPATPSSVSHTQSQFEMQQTRLTGSSRKTPSVMGLLPSSERDPTDMLGGGIDSGKQPYQDGPIEIIPGLFIGCEENVRDWRSLTERWKVGRVVNVAKELKDVLDEVSDEGAQKTDEHVGGPANSSDRQSILPERPLRRNTVSTPNLKDPISFRSVTSPTSTTISQTADGLTITEKTYVLPNKKTLDYLHLPWSHGQADLVSGAGLGRGRGGAGLIRSGDWIAEGLAGGVGVLVHCQCGVSRSATLVIAVIMQMAAKGEMPHLLGDIRGMHDAYEFVKEKSPWIGPNVSLIYQLLEWERYLAAATSHLPHRMSSTFNTERGFADESVESEEDWSRRRAALEAQEEAEQMDRQMEERQRIRESPSKPRPHSSSGTDTQTQSVLVQSSSVSSPNNPDILLTEPVKVRKRVSRSSMASVVMTEEDEGQDGLAMGYELGANNTPALSSISPSSSSDTDPSQFEPQLSPTSPSPSSLQHAIINGPQSSFSARRGLRKKSFTLPFLPSLDTLPSSPGLSTTFETTYSELSASTLRVNNEPMGLSSQVLPTPLPSNPDVSIVSTSSQVVGSHSIAPKALKSSSSPSSTPALDLSSGNLQSSDTPSSSSNQLSNPETLAESDFNSNIGRPCPVLLPIDSIDPLSSAPLASSCSDPEVEPFSTFVFSKPTTTSISAPCMLSSLSGPDLTSSSPKTRFGDYQSPRQRRDAHRRAFSVDMPIILSPLFTNTTSTGTSTNSKRLMTEGSFSIGKTREEGNEGPDTVISTKIPPPSEDSTRIPIHKIYALSQLSST
ncbi:Dual specificity phosphatase [Phaffia rhodozyma]|uniref:protein-tyrosine-phosphatase n=1 Tax=Phaffia rhodozyma TaxID=264483 RepID=A0A0F7STD6_PHARH|nr:Dual specificity phosphatase [Phaffia rhodozyma]